MDSFMYMKLLYVFCNIVTSDKFNASLLNKSLISNKRIYLSDPKHFNGGVFFHSCGASEDDGRRRIWSDSSNKLNALLSGKFYNFPQQ